MTPTMPDPLEPLRKMVEKWDGEYVKTLKFCCHGLCASELAAALPALEEAMAKLITERNNWKDISGQAHDVAEELQKELADLRSLGPCGQHPKMFWIEDQQTEDCDKTRHVIGYSLCPKCIPAHCALCAEREIGSCGKHPKMFWVETDPAEGVAPHCTICNELDNLCAERDAARGEAYRKAAAECNRHAEFCKTEAENGGDREHLMPRYEEAKYNAARILALDPSAVKR